MTEIGLLDTKMKDKHKIWTGKYGIHSEADFLGNPKAQEMALADLIAKYRKQLSTNEAMDNVGQRIVGILAPFEVTENGLLAAAHREGASRVRDYLEHQRGQGWRSEKATFPDEVRQKFINIETRLREFADIPHSRNQPNR